PVDVLLHHGPPSCQGVRCPVRSVCARRGGLRQRRTRNRRGEPPVPVLPWGRSGARSSVRVGSSTANQERVSMDQTTRSLRGLIGVLSADFAALSASRLLSIAVPWFVLTTTGSAVQTGLIAFCQITPFAVAQTLSGPLIDRIGPRRIAVAGDL